MKCPGCKKERLTIFFELDRPYKVLAGRDCFLHRIVAELRLDKRIFLLYWRMDQKGLGGKFGVARNGSTRLKAYVESGSFW